MHLPDPDTLLYCSNQSLQYLGNAKFLADTPHFPDYPGPGEKDENFARSHVSTFSPGK